MKLQTIIEQSSNKSVKLSQLVDDNILKLNKLYTSNGYELRIVGGAVRDILMDKTPKDIDLATNATPEESIKLLQDNNIKVIETGLQHGTITAHMNHTDYEITTLRIDKDTDGRHATVEFTKDWKKDAERRDLTFNAMSMDFNGVLYDYFGGHEDLKKGKAKFVGDTDKRVQEDYLRILRYFRFQGKSENPDFDSDTLHKIKNNARGLSNISGERIWSEMEKILSGDNLESIIIAMGETEVLKYIGLNGANTKELMQIKARTDDPTLLMAATLRDVNALDVLRDRWKFTTAEYNLMKFIIKNRENDINYTDAKKMHLLNRVDKLSIAKLLSYQGKETLSSKFITWNPPTFPINGDDLRERGIPSGPEMGKILMDLKNKWADSGYTLDKQALIDSI